MAKLNKKILAATLGAAAVAVTVPVILTSCSQGTEQNSGTGQDSIKNDAIVSTDGNSYNEAIVLDGASSVETVKAYLESNPAVIENAKTSLLKDTARFAHVDMEFKDVVKTGEDSYALVFESKLNQGFRYTDGTTESKDVNVALTNLAFKDASVNSSYNYDGAINVYEANLTESLASLQNYLTKDSNKVLNQIVDASLGVVNQNAKNIGSLQYVKDSIKQVNGKYQITLLAETKAKHLFANGSNQQSITINLNNIEFSKLGAKSSTGLQYISNIGQGAMVELKSMPASKASAEKWMSEKTTLDWLSTEMSNDLFANVEVTSFVNGSVKMLGDSGFTAQVVVSGKDRYVFADGIKSQVMNVQIRDAGWQYGKASASNATKVITNSFAGWGPNIPVVGLEPTQERAEDFVKRFGEAKLIQEAKNAGISNATISGITNYKDQVKLLPNGDIEVTFVATSNAFTRFSNGSNKQNVTVTITGLAWKKESSINGEARFNAKDISWFKGKLGTANSTELVRRWLFEQGGNNIVANELISSGIVKNATISFKTVGVAGDDNHVAVSSEIKAIDGFKFADGSTSKTINIWIDNMPW